MVRGKARALGLGGEWSKRREDVPSRPELLAKGPGFCREWRLERLWTRR